MTPSFVDPTPAGPRRIGFLARLSSEPLSDDPMPHCRAAGVAARFQGYVLERALARGASAAVWLARCERTERPVALKIGRAGEAPAVEAMFRREAEALSRLTHPRVVPLIEHGVARGARGRRPFLALAPRGPRSLEGALRSGRTLRFEEVRSLLDAVLSALSHLHARGVVHRDLKPSNLLLDGPVEAITLVDFGAALLDGESTPGMGATGTPRYMAPEQVRGDVAAQGPATDLYALGCLAHRLLTGRGPFDGRGRAAVLEAHLTETPTLATPRVPTPPYLMLWVRKLLAKRPAARFRSADEARDALRALASGG